MPDPKELKALQKKWYAKLKRTGFDDIEQEDGKLKKWHSFFFGLQGRKVWNSTKEEYYRRAGQFLHDNDFKSDSDKMIWELHSKGISIRNIIKIMKAQGLLAYRDLVQGSIQTHSKKMLKKLDEDEQE